MNKIVAPLVCAYCNTPMIAFEHLIKHAGSPIDSHYSTEFMDRSFATAVLKVKGDHSQEIARLARLYAI